MISRSAAFPSALLLPFCALAAAASCSSNASVAPSDAGSDAAAVDASDAGMPSIDSAGQMEGSSSGCQFPSGVTAPTGTQLVQSTTITADGVTNDGHAIYTDSSSTDASTGTIYAVPLTGGMPTAVGVDDGSGVQAIGPAVLSWTGVASMTGATYGALSVWTAATGAKSVATASPARPRRHRTSGKAGLYDVSADGKYVLYFDNDDGQTADLYVAGVDGSGALKLVAGASMSATCTPQVGFVGNYVVASTCPGATGDGGAPPVDAGDGGTASSQLPATLATWTGTGWTTMASVPANPGWSADAGGTQLAYASGAGLTVSPVGLGAATPIDAAGSSGVFTSDGTSILYVARDHSVRRSAVASPSPAVVLPIGDYLSILALSGDNKWMLLDKMVQSNGTSDLFFASTAPASSPTALFTPPGAGLFGDAFTVDSSHALFFTNVSEVGDYNALAVGGTKPVLLGGNAWEGFATSAAKVVYADNFVEGMTEGTGVADIQSVDTSAATPAPTTLVSSADATFFVTSDRKTIVYSWSVCAGAPAGLYAVTAP